jgi:hypothetical protein
MKFVKKILILSILVITPSVVGAEISSEDQQKINTFLSVETTEARNMLSSFSDGLLDEYTEQYKQTLKPAEARKFWIIEEHYKRKGDQTASDRLFYVFLSIMLTLALIFGLILKIFQMQKNLNKLE